jgi:hypothetical protein
MIPAEEDFESSTSNPHRPPRQDASFHQLEDVGVGLTVWTSTATISMSTDIDTRRKISLQILTPRVCQGSMIS